MFCCWDAQFLFPQPNIFFVACVSFRSLFPSFSLAVFRLTGAERGSARWHWRARARKCVGWQPRDAPRDGTGEGETGGGLSLSGGLHSSIDLQTVEDT